MKQLLLCVALFMPLCVLPQSYPAKEIDLQKIADEIVGYQDEDLNYEDLYENLLQLLSNPLNINTANAEQLRSLSILTELQIQSLLNYRNENGKLLSEYELQAVPELDLPTLYRLLPFVKVADPLAELNSSFLQRVANNDNAYFVLRYERLLETRKGFTTNDAEGAFKGSPDKLYMRFRSNLPNDFSVGFTAEKDAGEQVQWNTNQKQYGADFISFHAQVQNKGRIKNLIVGDYQLQYGQGLVLGGAFGTGKGGETITTVRRNNAAQLPFTSVVENLNLRGLTASYLLAHNFTITGFFSRTYRDANVRGDTTDDAEVTSFLFTGLHRNEKELADRKQLDETIAGGVLSYTRNSLDAGIIYQSSRYGKPIERTPSVYNQFTFEGTQNNNVSAYASYSIQNFNLFGEAAKSLQGGLGVVAGTIGSISKKLDVALVYRNYQRNFHSNYSNAFSEASTVQNERGFYWGLKYKFNKQYQLSGYVDFFEFPWLRFRSYSPSVGHEWLLRFQYQPSKTVALFVQVREELKQRNLSDESNFYTIANGVKQNLLINASYAIGSVLQARTRVQFSNYKLAANSTRGMVIAHDVTADFGKLKLTGRYAIFDTDDFDNRQYVVEKDMWLAFSFPAYSGTGVRQYILLQYDFSKKFTGWIRYAHTQLKNTDSIGSGLDETVGNERNEIKLQVRMKF
jgi:Helix-hairpin-helix motif